jgi:hypothetical protein
MTAQVQREMAQAFAVSRASFLVGALGTAAMITLYLTLISLAQGVEHALAQLVTDSAFVAPIALGFGVQMALFAELRHVAQLHRSSMAVTAGATGTSGAAMLACCAHHLVEILPLVGLSAAAVLLNEYRVLLLTVGLTLNVIGIMVIARQLFLARRSCTSAAHVTA